MMNLPPLWRTYACSQAELANIRKVSDRSWGLEAALDNLLAAPSPPNEEELKTTVETGGRGERCRAQLRRIHLVTINTTELVPVLEARSSLLAARAEVSANDWAVLQAVGEGVGYSHIAAAHHSSSGALRVRVRRLRMTLMVAR